MKMKTLLYVLTLTAYMLSLAHSVIPHHHHSNAQEAKSHDAHHEHKQKSDHHHHHDGDTEKNSTGNLGHLFFFTHDANVDVLHSYNTIEKTLQKNSCQNAIHKSAPISLVEYSRHLVFHPPQSDPEIFQEVLLATPLRAPPSI
jgi:hypothetical protein